MPPLPFHIARLLSLTDLIGLVIAILVLFTGVRLLLTWAYHRRRRRRSGSQPDHRRLVIGLICLVLGGGWCGYKLPQYDWPVNPLALESTQRLVTQYFESPSRAERQDALVELVRRHEHQWLPAATVQSITDRCLAIQADLNHPWDPVWADWLTAPNPQMVMPTTPRANLTESQIRTFIHSACRFGLDVPHTVLPDQPLVIHLAVDDSPRTDTWSSLVHYSALITEIRIDGELATVATPVEVTPDLYAVYRDMTTRSEVMKIPPRLLTPGRHSITVRGFLRSSMNRDFESGWSLFGRSPRTFFEIPNNDSSQTSSTGKPAGAAADPTKAPPPEGVFQSEINLHSEFVVVGAPELRSDHPTSTSTGDEPQP